MATMLMPSPRSLVLLLLLLSTPFFLLLPHPSSASLQKGTEDVNEAHVVVLTAANFSSFLDVRRHVVVDFYAPWSYWSRKLAPEYAAAASHLADKGLDVALAKVDATQDRQLARAYGIDGYSTVLFFVDGVPRDYSYYGDRTKDAMAMVAWISQRLGPAVQNVTTIDEAEKIINVHGVAVLAFLNSLSGVHSDELAAASRLGDINSLYRAVNFYQTTNPDVAKLFHVDPEAKRPSLVLLNKLEETFILYDGEFGASAIAEFVSANKIPLITYHPHTGSHPSSTSLQKGTEDVNEAHVVVLTGTNFTSFLAVRRHVVVDFYAPWSYWSRKLAPEYAAAASHLADKGLDVALAKVDATQDRQLARAHDVQGYPTVLFFVDGAPRHYHYGDRTRDAMVAWISQRLVPEVQNVTTIDEAEKIITGRGSVAVLAFLDSLSGAHADELAAASRLEDNNSLYRAINFYQTTSPDVAKLFHVDTEAKRPSLVLLNKNEEMLTVYDGEFRASAIAEFVSANKIPLITYHPHTGSHPSGV